MARRLYQYHGPKGTLALANGDELELVPGQRIEVEVTPQVRDLVQKGQLTPLRLDTKPSKIKRRRRRQEAITYRTRSAG